MAIYQNGITLADDLHSGLISPIGTYDLPIHVRTYFGLHSEGHVVGQPTGRELVAPIVFDGFSGIDTLQAAIDAKERLVSVPLLGDVTQVINSGTRTFRSCTFLGVEFSPENFRLDGVTSTWFVFAFYRWRQRGPN